MSTPEPIIFYSNKRTILIQVILCASLFTLGGWLLTRTGNGENAFMDRYHIRGIIGVLNILVFGSFLVVWLFKIADRKPGLVIDEKGITDHSTSISPGEIPWEDIESIRANVLSKNILTVLVRQPQKYIDRQKNSFKRKLLTANYKKAGSPVNIQTLSLKTDPENLVQIVESRLRRYKEN